jgi:hypothetical protein
MWLMCLINDCEVQKLKDRLQRKIPIFIMYGTTLLDSNWVEKSFGASDILYGLYFAITFAI